ncbi:NAD(P)/FAD-dependent oxidoreductase [Hyphomonas sp. NPDC076900]|uniref:NAD(P)/FAD-dependent oxidoreductase n=1 Tax=unclassified Hyphomonas TaxID=2630699 RepID=UPI003D02CD6D
MSTFSELSSYDPQYDPLRQAIPGHGSAYAPTYWIATAGPPPEDDGPVTANIDADVVIIGSGYTGLSCAIHLAREHGVKAVVLEANGVAWGCSTRNGGQAQLSAGRLKRSEWIQRWGLETAQAMHTEMLAAFARFRDLISDDLIDCDPQEGGHYYIAHTPARLPAMAAETHLFNETFGYGARMLSADELKADHVGDHEAHGAMWEPDGVGIHAAKLAFGYLRLARSLGARVHTSSPVTGWSEHAGKQVLHTPGGTVTARKVCVATGGYTSQHLHNRTRNRLLPILSNSIVTRPLTASELADCNIRVRSPLTDTRILRHYYRLLPCGRFQIGSRSAITGKGAPDAVHLNVLKQGMVRKFPALAGIELDYSWWGWVDVSHDMMPRIFQPERSKDIFYAIGYGGNGVMYSAQAGYHLANLTMGKTEGMDLPIFKSALPHFGPLSPFRRIGQRLSYVWYGLKDNPGRIAETTPSDKQGGAQ